MKETAFREGGAGVRPDGRAAGRAPARGAARAPSPSIGDVKGQDVLLFIDNIFRFVQAVSEVSTLLGRMPSAVGYQPTLADEMASCRSASRPPGAVRSPRCRPSTCPPTTTPTRRCSRRSPTSTPPPSCPETSPRWASTRPWTCWPRRRPSSSPTWWGSGTTPWLGGCRRSCSATRSCRTSSPSSASTSCPRRTR